MCRIEAKAHSASTTTFEFETPCVPLGLVLYSIDVTAPPMLIAVVYQVSVATYARLSTIISHDVPRAHLQTISNTPFSP